jgi:flagellar capping protein FliD
MSVIPLRVVKKKRAPGNLPAHVQGMIKQEERLLQQTLDQLTKKTTNRIRTITQEQNLLSAQLKVMEQRLHQSQKQSEIVHNFSLMKGTQATAKHSRQSK